MKTIEPGSDFSESTTIERNSSTSPVGCSHCGLAVPSGLMVEAAEHQFCCHGCRNAFALIHSMGAGEYYQYAENRLPVSTLPVETFARFDNNAFQKEYTREGPTPDLAIVDFSLTGLHCFACIGLIERLPQLVNSVSNARVNWADQSVRITFKREASLGQIAKTLATLGYEPSAFSPDAAVQQEKAENRKLLFNLGLAGACAGNNMLVTLAVYLGQFQGMSSPIRIVLLYYSAFIGLVSLLGPGRAILRTAWVSIRHRIPHMDLPVGLGITIAFIAGTVNLLLGADHVYFDSISVLVFALLLGRYIQFLQQRSAIQQAALLNRITPQFCLKLFDGQPVQCAVSEIEIGDMILVKQGESIPVDGTVEQAAVHVDSSMLTGESRPVRVEKGKPVFAGSACLDPELRISAKSTHANSRIAKLLSEVEESVRQKPRIVQFADHIGGKFVVAILLLALITAILWAPNGYEALNHAVALLIVACPCALALATPIAVAVGLRTAISRKILIKDGDAFEKVTRAEHLFLDKTGTLTEGNLQVVRWSGPNELTSAVVAIEQLATHPVSLAIVKTLARAAVGDANQDTTQAKLVEAAQSLEVSEFEISSNGVSGWVAGKKYEIGTRKFLENRGVRFDATIDRSVAEILSEGHSPVFVAEDGTGVAVMGIGDRVRGDAASLVASAQAFGLQVTLLTGDHPDVAHRVAEQAGIAADHCFAELLPEEKQQFLERSPRSIMVGDGVNDCSALSAADVGVAINTDIGVSARISSVVLNGNSLEDIVQLLTGSRRVVSMIRRNIGISLAYNLIAVGLAMGGMITPLVAAILMPISSLTVVGASLLTRPFPKLRRVQS